MTKVARHTSLVENADLALPDFDVQHSLPPRLGVTLVDGGGMAAVHSAGATRIEVCIFEGDREIRRVPLRDRCGDVHFGFVAGLQPGSRYGLRADGPWRPEEGLRFNSAKLLVDPYATRLDPRPSATGMVYPSASGEDDLLKDPRDTAGLVPKSIIDVLPTNLLRAPRPSPSSQVIYEAHPKGFSALNPAIPPALRGTLAGIAHPASVTHLVDLGITTLQLMPIMACLDERHLPELGLSNAWGYNTLAFLAPDPRLAPNGMADVIAMVDALHLAGIEVILDIVLNHSAESDEKGATLSLRGLDNRSYYRLRDGGRFYVNDTGCGNTLALDRPAPLRLAMDALRHWAEVGGVDGFRFDLGTVLGRTEAGFSGEAPLLAAIEQDPVLADRVMIVEPWDIGWGGYRLGEFPARYREWNDRYRDDVRRFWRGDGSIGTLATRLAGSADLFGARHRPPSASLNFVSAHDGFTLADTVRFASKMNHANGEDNRDGHSGEVSWSGGDRADEKALLATLLLSKGTPMLGMGSELGRTQHGNNNAYAQDNALNAIEWDRADVDLLEFTRVAIALRKSLSAITQDRYYEPNDIEWLTPSGTAITAAYWDSGAKLLGFATGSGDDRIVAWINGGSDEGCKLPFAGPGMRWRRCLHTRDEPELLAASFASVMLPRRSVTVWRAEKGSASRAGLADDAMVDALALQAGIAPEWWEVSGKHRKVSLDTKRNVLTAMGFPSHTADQAEESLMRLVALQTKRSRRAGRAWIPARLQGGNTAFGLAAQLYALRRVGDQGIGDFATLRKMAELAAGAGAATLAFNPVHARFPSRPDRCSPYQPSDRRFLDWAMVDLEGLPDGEVPRDFLNENGARLVAARQAAFIDYAEVLSMKREGLGRAHAFFRESATVARREDFARFVTAGGEALQRFGLFEALEIETGSPPKSLPDSVPAALAHAVEVALYRQFVADGQLRHAAGTTLSIGLFRDLAVGPSPEGAEVVTSPGQFLKGLTVGAPPDPFSASGQNWMLPPLDPLALIRTDFAHFRNLVAANLRHAGALRIDHVMALARLFVIPEGASAAEGTYIRYPLEDMLAVVAEESRRAQCLVIGEDLGTVPEGLRDALSEADILSYRVLFFERDGTRVRPPASWPRKAIACVSTHDLAPLAGWWEGEDIAIDRRLGRPVAPDAEATRAAERVGLIEASGGGDETLTPQRLGALHGLVASSPAMIAFAQVEELAGERVPVNVPGTDREYPNWSRRIEVPIETLMQTDQAVAILGAMAASGRADPARDKPALTPPGSSRAG